SIFQWRIGRGSFLPMSDSNPPEIIKESIPVTPAIPPAEQSAELKADTESSQNTTITQSGVETSALVSSNSDSVFYIIAGAFRSGDNAGKLRAELEQKGYAPHIIKLPCSSLLRVGYRQYATRREAHDQLSVIRKEDNNPDAWVLAVKK
ncbi:MAG TPA: SPOR domain-containing protein, partial [Bacteroidia bacterium]|nr:SPOR domain-containing protein [Bacteroidia bacterium]